MPTLGEFISQAKRYGYTKHTIRIPESRAKLVYLRRGQGDRAKLVEMPYVAEHVRLGREVVFSLCAMAAIPPDDFGLADE